MVRDARLMRSTDLIEILITAIPRETSAYNTNSMLMYLGGCVENFCPSDKYDGYMTATFDMLYELLKNATDENKVSKYKSSLVSYCWSTKSLEVLSDWIQGKNEVLKKFTPTLQERYSIISYLFARSVGTLEWRNELRAKLEAEDKTDLKKEYGFRIAALTADKEQREVLWADYMNPKSELSYHMMGISCAGFNSKWVDYSLREPYFERYYELVINQLKTRSRQHGAEIYQCLKPHYKNVNDSVLKSQGLMKSIDGLDKYWQKNLKDTLADGMRKQKVLTFAENKEKL